MKYKVNIPEGCKVMTVEVIDDRIILQVDKENQHQEFKENDIVYTDNNGYKRVSIIKSFDDNMFIETKATFHITKNITYTDEELTFTNIRFATDLEKQLLFDKLKEKCLMFDGENVVRWRAVPYKKYFYLPGDGDIAETEDDMSNWDDGAYHIGNYFPTRKMAEAFQKVYIESLNNFHKNL